VAAIAKANAKPTITDFMPVPSLCGAHQSDEKFVQMLPLRRDARKFQVSAVACLLNQRLR
jgi:hypothetical protein